MDHKYSLRKRKRPADENSQDSTVQSKKFRSGEAGPSSVLPNAPIETLPVEVMLKFLHFCSEQRLLNNSLNQFPQILDYIFSFLDSKSLKTASVVKKTWLQHIFSLRFAKKFPLTFHDCSFYPRSEPKTVFQNTKKWRVFPCIQIGKVTGSLYYDSLYDIMAKIGQHTQYLYLSNNYCVPPLILTCFHNLKELHLKNLTMIKRFDVLPESLRTITIDYASNYVQPDILARLRNFNQIERVQCNKFSLAPPRVGLGNDVQFLKVSNTLNQFLEKYNLKRIPLKITKNLLSDRELTIEDVYGLDLEYDSTAIKDLIQFTNLRVRLIDCHSCLSCLFFLNILKTKMSYCHFFRSFARMKIQTFFIQSTEKSFRL